MVLLLLSCLLILSSCQKARQQGPLKVTWEWDKYSLRYTIALDGEREYLAELSMPTFTGPGVELLDLEQATWRITSSKGKWLGATEVAEHVAELYSVFWKVGTFPKEAVSAGQWKPVAGLWLFEEVAGIGINPTKNMKVLRGFASMMDSITKAHVAHLTGLRGIPIASDDIIEVEIPVKAAYRGTYEPDPMDRFSIRYVLTDMSAFYEQEIEASYYVKIMGPGNMRDLGTIRSVEDLFEDTKKNRGSSIPYGISANAFFTLKDDYMTYYLLTHPDELVDLHRVYVTNPTLTEVVESANVTTPHEIADYINPGAKRSPVATSGKLDCVLCIDKSGSMTDDIAAVQTTSGEFLDELMSFSTSNNLTMQVGLVTYSRHDDPDWLRAWPLTSDIDQVRRNIQNIRIENSNLGAGGNEDLYGAMMYAMNQLVGGQQVDMRWRAGAAKILVPVGDEPPDEPDWEGRTLANVARVARALDPVHVYPVILPKQRGSFLNPTIRAMRRIARKTGGQTIQVSSAEELPPTLVDTVKLAVRRHRDEVWRTQHPPYFLYAVLIGTTAIIVLTVTIYLLRTVFRRPASADVGRH